MISEENGEISITDTVSDSRHIKANNNGTDICHNVQIAVDDKSHLVVAIDVTSSPADQGQLENMDLYKKRQTIVEHVFGTVKRDLGYTYLLLRKNGKLKGESFMHFLIYNIKKYVI